MKTRFDFKNIGLLLGVSALLSVSIAACAPTRDRYKLLATPAATGVQQDIAALLTERLKQRGIPVKEVNASKNTPYDIAITLQSSSNNDSKSDDDLWHRFITAREATLAYRFGQPVNSYKILLINSSSKVIDKETTFLQPSFNSQKLPILAQSKVDDVTLESLFIHQFDLNGMKLDSQEVQPYDPVGKEGQVIQARVAAQDTNMVNLTLAQLIASFRSTLVKLNSDFDSQIVLGRLTLVDMKGKRLAEYLVDVEIGTQAAFYGEGVNPIHGVGSPFHSPLAMPTSASPLATPMPTKTGTQ